MFSFATGAHNVNMFLNYAAYTNCDFSTATLLSSNGPYNATITSLPAYFGCSFNSGEHCAAGMKVAVNQAGGASSTSTASSVSSSAGLSTAANSAFGVADIASASHYFIVASVLGHLLFCLI